MLSRIRERREEQRERHRYQMREKLISFGDDYYIQNEHGQRVFFVDGKMLRIRKMLLFKDMHGHELLEIQERLLAVRDTMAIERGRQAVARVHKAVIAPLRDRFNIDVQGGSDLVAQGNILHHEYDIKRAGQKIAEISKRWFRLADTYGVEVEPGEDDILILAITVCIDAMAHEG